MTLTEGQQAALKRVVAYMDEMYSVASPYHGCTEDANLLRAMIDSSGTVEPTGGFDLERARGLRDFLQDDCAEVGDVWGEMIAEIERLRAGHCADCCCARSWEALGISEYTGKSIPEEITHLQEWVIKNRDIATDLQYQLDDEVKENERLLASLVEHENQTHAILGAILGTDDTLENVAKRAMARIAELEKWLKKERSARLLEKSVSILLAYLTENDIDFDNFFDGKALEQLKAEGKIGSGDHIVGPNEGVEPDAKPRTGLYGKYRISKADGSLVDPNADYFILRLDTDPVARKAALQYSYMTPDRKLAIELQKKLTKYNPKMADCINLQFFGMEKPKVWQITEERKATLAAALKVLERLRKVNTDTDHSYLYRGITVLRTMLTEAE